MRTKGVKPQQRSYTYQGGQAYTIRKHVIGRELTLATNQLTRPLEHTRRVHLPRSITSEEVFVLRAWSWCLDSIHDKGG